MTLKADANFAFVPVLLAVFVVGVFDLFLGWPREKGN